MKTITADMFNPERFECAMKEYGRLGLTKNLDKVALPFELEIFNDIQMTVANIGGFPAFAFFSGKDFMEALQKTELWPEIDPAKGVN